MSAPGPHPRPSAVELLEAVEEWLRGEVVGRVEGVVGFHARVAANAVAVVRRELEAGSDPVRAHADRLEALGAEDDAALGEAIRSGALDDRWDELLDLLRASVRAAVEVANPGHLELPPEPPLP